MKEMATRLTFKLLVIVILLSVLFSGEQRCIFAQVNKVFLQRIHTYPTTSCYKHERRGESITHCFFLCNAMFGRFHTVSRHVSTKECLCCKDPPASESYERLEWDSFARECPKEFIGYENDTVRTCLLAELTPKNYTDAVSHCQAKGGDLIRLDSTEKFQMLQDVVADYLNEPGYQADVWIQARRDQQYTWRFHDGALLTHVCPMAASNSSEETHIRYSSKHSRCAEITPGKLYPFVCELLMITFV